MYFSSFSQRVGVVSGDPAAFMLEWKRLQNVRAIAEGPNNSTYFLPARYVIIVSLRNVQRTHNNNNIVTQCMHNEDNIVTQRTHNNNNIVTQCMHNEDNIVTQRTRNDDNIVTQRTHNDNSIVTQRTHNDNKIVTQCTHITITSLIIHNQQ